MAQGPTAGGPSARQSSSVASAALLDGAAVGAPDFDVLTFSNFDVSQSDFRFAKLATRTPATVEFAGAEAGQTAHYILRWVNTRGEPGPMSAAAMATITG